MPHLAIKALRSHGPRLYRAGLVYLLGVISAGALADDSATPHTHSTDGTAPAFYLPKATSSSSPSSAPAKQYPVSTAGTIRGEALDEPRGGMTLHGSPVTPRTDYCFPAEPRDLFWKMDQVVDPKTGKLGPLNFDEDGDGTVDNADRDGIRGRNTWLLWGGGNEVFWEWLQERGYGLMDFLILLDSRKRGTRFKDAGLINQPGFEEGALPILGLYLDKAGKGALLRPPGATGEPPPPEIAYGTGEPELFDAQNRRLPEPVLRPSPPPNHPTQLFPPWTTARDREEQWKKEGNIGPDPYRNYVPEIIRKLLPQDGLDTNIYGYPSGIFGLRLLLNPDFFGPTDDAARARAYWKERVENTRGRYYFDPTINSDPNLIRPFRVTMSCGFCHVAPHPLNPPADPEKPEWENLSSIIGNQYWDPQPAFGSLLRPPNFLHHFLKSQAPGTIDTSLVSTDHINNTNVINAIFDVPARLTRAMNKPTETQSRSNLLVKSIEDPETSNNPDGVLKERHFPMVLFPGEDSVGIFGALQRVPLNIGVFSEQWARCDNPVIGYTPQRPFRVEVGRANSVYWNVNEKYRVGYMASFFTLGRKGIVPKSTAPMKLKDAGPDGLAALAVNSEEQRDTGRTLFLKNCAICHSSRQPKGFDLRFTREEPSGGWSKAPVPAARNRFIYTLPMENQRWQEFRQSPAFQDYREQIITLAGAPPADGKPDPFLADNFLSNELRIPVTLVGTYAGRALATNAMRGQVWDNFSSETFKNLPSVGKIRYYNPYAANASAAKSDYFGANDAFDDGRSKGGPGYFRPASLISLWATGPYFHNNALGLYTHDPSVKGRMIAFNDGIRKLLWNEQRPLHTRDGITYDPPGDLRPSGSSASINDPGYIYRLPVDTYVMFQPGFIRPLIEGLLVGYLGMTFGDFAFTILSFWWWVVFTIVFVALIFYGKARQAGVFLILLAIVLSAVLFVTGAGGGGTLLGVLMMGTTNLMAYDGLWVWGVVAVLAFVGFLLLMTRRELKKLVRIIFLLSALVTLFAGILVNKFLNGRLKEVNPVLAVLPNSWLNAPYKGIHVGPIPRGTPVNLIMNLDPDKTGKVAPALVALLQALAQIDKQHLTGEEAYQVLAKQAGPALMAASKCPDFVLDHGHYFGETLTPAPGSGPEWEKQNNEAKEALIAFLKTL